MKTKTLLVGLIPFALAPALAAADVNQPQEIIDRPLTTPASQLTIGADVLLTLAPSPVEAYVGGLGLLPGIEGVGVKYGVNEKLEVGVGYSFALKEFEAKGDIQLGVAYSVLHDEKLDIAANLGLGYSPLLEGIDPIRVGAEVRFKITSQLAIYSPGQQLSIGIADETGKGMSLSLPVGILYQANPQIHAHIDTSAGTLAFNDEAGDSAFLFADNIPLTAGAFFSPSNTMDFGAAVVFPDLKAEGDLKVGVVGSLRLHM